MKYGNTAVVALMSAVGVIVPLGLVFTAEYPEAWHWLIPFDAAANIAGWMYPPGSALAIAPAVLHLVVGLCAAYKAYDRMVTRGWTFPLPELALDFGLLFIPAGAAWLLATRAGYPLLGFHEPVVMFTAAHFHFAGFAAPTILGAVAPFVDAKRLPYRIATSIVLAGVPLTAIGIATNHTLEVGAAVVLASGILVAAFLLVFVASRNAWTLSKPASVLFVLSGLSLFGTMALAATFATTAHGARAVSDGLAGAIPTQTMIDLHGGGNAFGFALLALLGLSLIPRQRWPIQQER